MLFLLIIDSGKVQPLSKLSAELVELRYASLLLLHIYLLF